MITFRHLSLAAILGLSVWALWPPAKSETEQAVEAEATTKAKYHIRMAPGVYMPGRRPMDTGEKLKALSEVAADFRKLYPDTSIEFVDAPQNREYLVTQLMGEQAPDIINLNVEDVWQDVQKGWYIPLDKYLEAPNEFAEAGKPGSRQWWDLFKYQAISRGKAAPDGKMYCVTLDMIETGIYYNKDIFKKVGVAPPKDWPEFLAIQEKIKQAGEREKKAGKEGFIPMLVGQGSLADWGVDLMFDQMYRGIRPLIDLKKDPKRAGYMKGYLDWDEVAFLYKKGFFHKDDPRWREVFRQIKNWRKYFARDFTSVDMERSFITQKGAMFWSSSFTVNKLARDPNLGFEWGVFYLPPVPKSYVPYAEGFPMCVIGGAATQLTVTNSANNDTQNAETSEKLKRVVAFLQFLSTPKQAEKVINEILALLPNIVGAEPRPELHEFAEILKRDYGMTKWMFTFDLRFNEIFTRMFYLYLQDGIGEEEFMNWLDKNIGQASETIINRKKLDLSPLEREWQKNTAELAKIQGLPGGFNP